MRNERPSEGVAVLIAGVRVRWRGVASGGVEVGAGKRGLDGT